MTEPYTWESDYMGGAILTRTCDGASVYFQPGEDRDHAELNLGSRDNPPDSSVAAEYFESD